MKTRAFITNFMARAMMTLLVMTLTTSTAWADLSGRCGKNLFFNYSSSTQTLEFYIGTNGSTGSMTNYEDENSAPWKGVLANITTVIIGEGVTSIGNYAFYGCTALTDVTIPNTVTDIGNNAFHGCTSLTTLVFPDNLLRIGYAAFSGCELLAPVELPNTVISIEDFAFEKCKALTTFTFPDGVKNINRSVFKECTSLASFTIPDGVTSIGNSAFMSCTALMDVSIPNSVTSIGEQAFRGCSSLESITIPDGVTSIGKQAFMSCTALMDVSIPNSVTSIGEQAFYNCSSLTTVYCYAPTPPTLVRNNRGILPFYRNASSRKFYVFNDYVDEYKAAWSDYSGDIIGIPPFSVVLNDNAANISVISESMHLLSNVTLNSRTLYLDGDWNTLCLPFSLNSLTDTPLEGFTVKELDTEAENNGHKTGFDSGTLYLNFKDATSIEAGKPYIVKSKTDLVIGSGDDWNAFAQNVSNGTSYEGQLVRLGDDISVSTMAGTSDCPFKGTFDGGGYTINVNLNGGGEGLALFYAIDGATIQNVKVTGSVSSSNHRPATFTAIANGNCTIKNCWSNVDIVSTRTTSWVDGGAFVARVTSGATLNMTDCAFSGSITYHGGISGGGMVGFTQSGAMANLTNCFFNPSALTLTVNDYSPCIFVSGDERGNLTNCYYNTVANESVLENEGIDGSSMSTVELASALGTNWEVSGDNVLPKCPSDI